MRRVLSTIGACLLTASLVLTGSPAQAQTLPESRQNLTTYTVVRGDTLSKISKRFCGSASRFPSLAAASRISNPNLIYPGQRIVLNCSARAAAKASRSTTRTTTPTKGWVLPVNGSRLVSCYRTKDRPGHNGIDMAVGSGTPIRAAAAGRVAAITYQAGRAGWYVVLSHPGGVYTVYMHMRTRSPLSVGRWVSAGQTIGYVGMTGDASGPHLHFEVQTRLWSTYTNPATWLRAHGVRVGC